MKDIIIVGAGHLGLDIYDLIKEINSVTPTWNIKGFLNDFPVDLKDYCINEKIIGTIKEWVPSENEHFVMAIGSPMGKEKVSKHLKDKGAVFETLISPFARVSDSAVIEEGAVIMGRSNIGQCVKIGKFVVVGDTTISLHSIVGDYSNTASYVNIYRDINIGKRVQIWSHAVILKAVEDDAVVGAGSVVVSKVKAGTKVMGNPAKKISL